MTYLKTALEIITVICLYFAIVGALHEVLTFYQNWWTTSLYIAVISTIMYYLIIMIEYKISKLR